ncbi:hypothetical protein [Candidatus Albibeggiatoa sp. nov. BB20]|uniref:hypothetical protein n=1 Tax=Candidatus Albibeggiatoa sp. nov. BB20 TaxID=3162723 RepID=UPI0033659470
MAKPFKLLKDKMSEESQQRAEVQKRLLLAEIALQESIEAQKIQKEQPVIPFNNNMSNVLVSSLESCSQTCQKISYIIHSHNVKVNTSHSSN